MVDQSFEQHCEMLQLSLSGWGLRSRRKVETMKLLDSRQRLSEPAEFLGYWWLPTSPNASVAGTLRYAPNSGCSLELMGHLDRVDLNRPIDVLQGATAAGDLVTLLQVVPTRTRFVRDTFPTYEHTCAMALVGNYHPNLDLFFSKAAIQIEHLEQWLHLRHVRQDRLDGRPGITFTVEVGDHGELTSAEGYTVTAEAGFSAKSDDRHIDLQAAASLRIQAGEPRDLHWFMEEARALQDLASVCFGLPEPLTSVRFYGEERELAPGVIVTEGVAALFWEQTPARKSRGSYPLVQFRGLATIAPDILDAWKNVRATYRDVIDLVLLTLARHHVSPEVGFLLAMQAFEAFDRIRSPKELVAVDVFEAARNAMAAAIPAIAPRELRDKLLASIKFANEPSLRQRLKAFHKRLSAELNGDALGLTKPAIDRLVDTRNFYTHYAEALRPNILSPDRQVEETERFCALLILSILNVAGVPFEAALRGLDFHEHFRQFGLSFRENALPRATLPSGTKEMLPRSSTVPRP